MPQHIRKRNRKIQQKTTQMFGKRRTSIPQAAEQDRAHGKLKRAFCHTFGRTLLDLRISFVAELGQGDPN